MHRIQSFDFHFVFAAAPAKKSPAVKKKLGSQDEEEELYSDSFRARHALRRVDERLQVNLRLLFHAALAVIASNGEDRDFMRVLCTVNACRASTTLSWMLSAVCVMAQTGNPLLRHRVLCQSKAKCIG